MKRLLPAACVAVLTLSACSADPTPSPKPACPDEAPTATSAQASLEGAEMATVSVTGAVEGEFAFELYGTEAPIATASFVELVRCGFYDGVTFHRVLAGFVIQAGDPATADPDADPGVIGRGGPDYRYDIESPAPNLAYDIYSVSMANDTRSNGSQFFVAVADLAEGLPRTYTIFGQVVSGTETVDAIAAVPVSDPRVGMPVDAVTITSIRISAADSDEADD